MSQGEIFLTDKLKSLIWFPPEERQTSYAMRGGNDDIITLGRPFWRISAEYENLDATAFRLLRSWLTRRMGSRVTFTAFDPSARAPLLAPSLTNTGLGVSAISIASSTVTISGVGSTVISPGDKVSFYTANLGYWCGEATATASPSGGSVVIPVHPYPQTPHASTPSVRLLEALAEFKIAGLPRNTGRHTKRNSVSFEAVQVVR